MPKTEHVSDWQTEDLGRGLTRMRQEVTPNLVLLAASDHWVAYDPTNTEGPSLAVGSYSDDDGWSTPTVTDAMLAAEQWLAFHPHLKENHDEPTG